MSWLSTVIRTVIRRGPGLPVPRGSADRPPLVLHIGPHKTGTTAIQLFCERNRKALSKAGFWYPEVGIFSGQHMRLPGCYIRHHACIPQPLLGGCPEEIVASMSAEAPRGLTSVMSSEVFWELLCYQPEAFESAVSMLEQRYRVHILVVERPIHDRVWSAIKFSSRLGLAIDPVGDFSAAFEFESRAQKTLNEMDVPVIRVSYDGADCITPFLNALPSPCLSRQTVRPSKLKKLVQKVQGASSTLRENVAPTEPWYVAFTMEFSRRLMAARGRSQEYDGRIATFLQDAMAIGSELESTRRLPDEDMVFQRVLEAAGSLPSLLTPAEVQAWETLCRHPGVQLAAMRAGCLDAWGAVSQTRSLQRRAA